MYAEHEFQCRYRLTERDIELANLDTGALAERLDRELRDVLRRALGQGVMVIFHAEPDHVVVLADRT